MKMRDYAAGLVALLAVGCSKQPAETAPATQQAARATAAPRRATNVITSEELAKSNAQNAFQAVQLLRPNWLRDRGPTSLGGTARTGGVGSQLEVYFDNNRYGGVASLRQLSLDGISEMRYLDPAEATNRFGSGHTMGAIVIKYTRQ